jgi:predicted Na+-dependent transporter
MMMCAECRLIIAEVTTSTVLPLVRQQVLQNIETSQNVTQEVAEQVHSLSLSLLLLPARARERGKGLGVDCDVTIFAHHGLILAAQLFATTWANATSPEQFWQTMGVLSQGTFSSR